MPLDAICVSAVAAELSDVITGAKIDKIQQPERDMLIFSLRGRCGSVRLLISAGSGGGRVHLTEAAFENPAAAPMFCMLMRKHLTGARIVSVRQEPMERMVEMELEATDAMGEPSRKKLVAELMGKHSNIILVDGEGRIVDCLRRVDMEMSEKRQVLPGLIYRLPPKPDRLSPLDISGDKMAEILFSDPSDRMISDILLDTFYGLSPLVCRELCHLAYGDTDIRASHAAGQDKGAAFIRVWTEFAGMVTGGKFEPYMLTEPEGKPRDFSYMPIKQYEAALILRKEESFSALLDSFYTLRDRADRMRQKSQSLSRLVKNARDRAVRKLLRQQQEMKEAEGRELFRQNGDIIMANLHAVKRGDTVLRALDFYSEDGSMREIALDPKKNPQQNAAAYYKSYNKLKNAQIHLAGQIDAGEKDIAYLESVLDALLRADGDRDLAEIRQELTDTGYIKAPRVKKKEKRLEGKPMRFKSSSGLDIWVGRNNVQNDRLTMKTAFKRDMWLHTQKIHGSHVIISTAGGDVDDTSLSEAAAIAAYFSQGRDSGAVPVDYTLVKNVKKPPGAKPGMVIYTDYKTVIARPDKSLVEKLRID